MISSNYICNDLQKTGIGCFLQFTLGQKYTFTHIKHSVSGVESSTLFLVFLEGFFDKGLLTTHGHDWLQLEHWKSKVPSEDLRRIVDLHTLGRSLVVFSDVSPLCWGLLEVPNSPSDKRQLVKRSRNHRGSSLPWMENYWNSSITFHSEVGFPSSTKRASTKEVDRVPKSTL